MTARVERVVTSGVFSLDGQDFDVENNVWLVGDDEEVLVVDAAHDAGPILAAIGGRRVVAIACTHGHNDHVNAAGALRAATGAPVLLHPADTMLWSSVYADQSPDRDLDDGAELVVARAVLRVLHTPGHTPGGVCLHAPALRTVFSGDTLFKGGPGATGRSFSDFPTLVESIRSRLLDLPATTTVRTGHGDDTTIGAESPYLQGWLARGH